MTITDIATIIVKLEARLASLGNGHDKTSDDELAKHWRTYHGIARTLTALRNASSDLATLDARVADLNTQRQTMLAMQTELEQQIASAPDLREMPVSATGNLGGSVTCGCDWNGFAVEG